MKPLGVEDRPLWRFTKSHAARRPLERPRPFRKRRDRLEDRPRLIGGSCRRRREASHVARRVAQTRERIDATQTRYQTSLRAYLKHVRPPAESSARSQCEKDTANQKCHTKNAWSKTVQDVRAPVRTEAKTHRNAEGSARVKGERKTRGHDWLERARLARRRPETPPCPLRCPAPHPPPPPPAPARARAPPALRRSTVFPARVPVPSPRAFSRTPFLRHAATKRRSSRVAPRLPVSRRRGQRGPSVPRHPRFFSLLGCLPILTTLG